MSLGGLIVLILAGWIVLGLSVVAVFACASLVSERPGQEDGHEA